MLHRIYIGENVNNVIAVRRLNTRSYGDILYECKCGLCGKRIERTELKLRLMVALPCNECCRIYHIHDVTKRTETAELI